ncbi:MAG: hypothetical protein HGA61_02520 [Candidatus Moranbacteria bacterium]|nr:hypothetical protein [Candidatus Moranbacteria bacterium]
MKTYLKSVGEKNKQLREGDREFLFDSKTTTSGGSTLTVAQSCKNQKGNQIIKQAMVFRGNFKDLFPSLQQVSTFLK